MLLPDCDKTSGRSTMGFVGSLEGCGCSGDVGVGLVGDDLAQRAGPFQDAGCELSEFPGAVVFEEVFALT